MMIIPIKYGAEEQREPPKPLVSSCRGFLGVPLINCSFEDCIRVLYGFFAYPFCGLRLRG